MRARASHGVLARRGGVVAALALAHVAGCASHRDDGPRGGGPIDRAAERALAVRRAGAVPRGDGAWRPQETADAAFTIEGSASVKVSAALLSADRVTGRVVAGLFVYAHALPRADLVRVPLVEGGVEDFVFFETRPREESLAYSIDVRDVAGLRLVGGSLELLDRGGAPRVRVDRPWVVGADGVRSWASLAVEGCALDEDPSPPWGREVTATGGDRCLLRVTWSGVRYPAVVDPAWRLGGSLSPRHHLATITFGNGRVLAISGTLSTPGMGNGPVDSTQFFDPTTGTWAGGPSLPSGRVGGVAALTGTGRAFVLGGGGSPRPELLTSAGGAARSDATISFGDGVAATSLANGRVLVTGPPGNQALLYDEPSDTFLPAGVAPGRMLVARGGHTATRLSNGKVLLAGGTGGAPPSAEIYDPVTNTFTATAGSMVVQRADHTASVLPDGKVLLAGGGSATTEIFDPATGTFTASGVAAFDRRSGQAVVLASGDVMFAGGQGGAGASVEIYDAKAHTFSAQPPLSFPRTLFGAARVPDGSVVVFGGLGASTFSLAATEIWTPGAPGVTCGTGDDCRSGVCEEGVCCVAACAGACQTCVSGTGACAKVTGKDDPSSCTGADTCDAAGACKKKNGQRCAAAADCASAQCVDGTCCDRACAGQCEACDVTGFAGTCVPVAGTPRNARPACAAPGTTCGGACNGLDGVACAYPSAITTCAASCGGERLTQSTCDGRGACVADVPRGCPGNFVCDSATTCKTACATNADCATGYQCEAGSCLPVALCEERFVTRGSQRIDCFPYTCEQSGACRTSCASVADCAAPTLCALDGRCVDPPGPSPSGCSASPRSPFGVPGLGGLAFGLAALASRVRRRGGRS